MNNPDWWPAWTAYTAIQREYEAAVEGLSALDRDRARQEMERVRREIIPRRNAAFEAFRVEFAKR